MDRYGDGNVYRGQVCKDHEIKTIVINQQTPNYEMGCRVSKVTVSQIIKTAQLADDCYYPAADVERLVEAARAVNSLIPEHEDKNVAIALEKLEATLEPFKEVK